MWCPALYGPSSTSRNASASFFVNVKVSRALRSLCGRVVTDAQEQRQKEQGSGEGKKEEGNQQNTAFMPKGIKDDLFWGQEGASVTQEQRFSSPGHHAPMRKQFHKGFIMAK